MSANSTVEKLKSKFGEAILKTEEFRKDITVFVKREQILDVMEFLKSDAELSYDFLIDITAVDYLRMEKNPRFQMVYNLRSTKYNQRIRVKVPLSESDLKISTLAGLWKGAAWLEREVYEMYGVSFENHPDLRRLLIPDSFKHFPLRKDYPLRGKGEREIILPEGS